MVSNLTFLIIMFLTISIACFSPLTGLILSIAICAAEVAFLYINQDDFTNV